MYCIKCGVQLADSEKRCPLCQTVVSHPDFIPSEDTPYPRYQDTSEKVSPKGINFIFSFLFLIAALICLTCDIKPDLELEWAGYAIGSMILFYVIFLLPVWFEKHHPQIFLPCCFGVIALFLWYICYSLGGNWYFTFALPITLGVALIFCTVVILCKYLKRGRLYIFGGASIALAGLMILIEELVVFTFEIGSDFVWSIYPAIAFTLIGIMLIVIAIVKPLKESLRRIFAIG